MKLYKLLYSTKKDLIIDDYLLELIPPGTKGVIRGNKFNKIVKETIDKFISGINVSIFAYGQTSTGKTFTMTGL